MKLQIEESFKDPIWRLNNLYYIVDKDSNKIKFKENSVQQKINASTHKRNIVLKARQFGVTTNEVIKMLDYVIWNKNVTAVILAHEQDSIKKIFRIVRRAYDSLNPKYKPQLDRGGGSQYELFFTDINSRIYCDLESRGDTINYLHVSECAFMKDPNRLKATLQAVPLHGKVTVETTPNGMGNFFYDMWSDFDSPYTKLFFPWYVFKDYTIEVSDLKPTDEELELIKYAKKYFNVQLTDGQLAFRRLKKSELKDLFIQEYPEDDQSCFLSSGQTVMNLQLIKEFIDRSPEPVSEVDDLTVFKTRNKDHLYVIGADTSEGVGGDFSVASVFDASTHEQVAILRGQFKPAIFARRIYQLSKLYKTKVWPELAVEANNHGHAVLLELDEHIQYPVLYKYGKDRLGWKTDSVTRPIMVNGFVNAVENESVQIYDKTTLKECLTFVNKNGKIEAADGKHDDCIISCAIAIQLLSKSIKNNWNFYV